MYSGRITRRCSGRASRAAERHSVRMIVQENLVVPLIRMIRTLLVLLSFSVCISCAVVQPSEVVATQRFIVEGDPPFSPEDAETLFTTFRSAIEGSGYAPAPQDDVASPYQASFLIVEANSGGRFNSEWDEILELSYSGDSSFEMNVKRVGQESPSIWEGFAGKFIQDAEMFFTAASSQTVNVRELKSR